MATRSHFGTGAAAAVSLALLAAVFPAVGEDAAPKPSRQWSLDDRTGAVLLGDAEPAPGVNGKCLSLDGRSVVQLPDSADLTEAAGGFSLAVWVNPRLAAARQQMIAAKNRYSLDQRQWGVMLDKDGRFRLYVWQGKWATVGADAKPRPGHWHLLGVVVGPQRAELWLDGKQAGAVPLSKSIPDTEAPITLGGVNDNGRIWQTLLGAVDHVQLFDRPLSAVEMASLYHPVAATLPLPPVAGGRGVHPDPAWQDRAASDAGQDRSHVVFDGRSPNQLACDTTLRQAPDGSWVMVMLGGGDREPLPQNQVFLTRSQDQGKTWAPMKPLDFGFPRRGDTAAMVPSELMVHDGRCTLFFATHDGRFGGWREWRTVSDDSCKSWSKPQPAPGRLAQRTFIRNHIVTRDGRVMLPFQHYLDGPGPRNPRNGVLISSDGGKTWSERGDIRLSSDDNYRGWAENNIVELSDGRIAMIIRADGLGGVLYYAESNDGGRTWPKFASPTPIPNPGSKATLYPLGGDAVALLHNPNPRHRSPLALWVSFDGLQSWPYQRVLVEQSSDGPRGRLNYPDGFVSDDKRWLHFAYDDNRHRAVYLGAKLPATE